MNVANITVLENAFASLSSLFEKSASGVELNADERTQLALRFDQQLAHLLGTLNSSSLGVSLYLNFSVNIRPTQFPICNHHSNSL